MFLLLRKRKLKFLLYRQSGELFLGQLVDKIITLIPSFMVGTSKNKNIDYQVKKTCATMLTKVTYETDHIPLLCDSTISSAPNFCLCILL